MSEIVYYVNRFGQSVCSQDENHMEERIEYAYNKGFTIAGVPCFADTFVQDGSSVLRMKFSADKPVIANP